MTTQTKKKPDSVDEVKHPIEKLLRMDRIPHIWCPACGIGIAVNAFSQAITQLDLDHKKIAIVSGIGCTGRVAGYLNLDSFHTTHGRAIPFATGLKLANPELTVVVFSGDGDLFAIGGNHFIHAARRNVDINVFCVNNFIYGMTGGQVSPTTPIKRLSSTTPYGSFEPPFNLPYLAMSSGAVYVTRYTALHVRRLKKTFRKSLARKGFCFVEIVAPCPTVYARRNRLGTGLDMMRFYHENSIIKHGANPEDAAITAGSKIIVGKFREVERPTFTDMVEENLLHAAGDGSKPVPKINVRHGMGSKPRLKKKR
jgi:2-oxoglutarate ferredoxin oxidoreductase subunit beta